MIDRKTASGILGCSIRTIDRYIRRGVLTAQRSNGKILLDKKQIMEARSRTGTARTPDTLIPVHIVRQARSLVAEQGRENGVYRNLYEESRRLLTEHQYKLQEATYRIGQLESQITSHANRTIAPENIRANDRWTDRELSDRDREITILKETLKTERAGRIIFAMLTYLLLAFIPVLWFLLR